MDINFTRICFLQLAVVTGLLGVLIFFKKNLPVSITRTYCYGKYAVKTEHAFVSRLEVPKRWFKHFYEFAAPASSFVLVLTISKYIFNTGVPEFFNSILDLQLGSQRRALVTPECTLLAIILLTIQCWKRWYETHRVSIFSDGKINLVHYIVGFVHYIGTISCLVGESEGFVKGSEGTLHWDRITKWQYVSALIFLAASYEQLRTNYILANLRKDKEGKVVTTAHKIPHGRLFEYISAPLQFTEIIMYAMLSIILWSSSTYHYAFFWVLANQCEVGFFTHRWYQTTFKNYPQRRMAFIPFLL